MSAALGETRLKEALQFGRLSRASDIHLHTGFPPVFRVDGKLSAQSTVAIAEGEIEAMLHATLDAPARKQLHGVGDVSVRHADSGAGDVRIHAYRTFNGNALAVRLLFKGMPKMESLQLPRALEDLSRAAHGLVIVSGPTGSGKTTALAAVVDHINATQAKHIVTIEDPIEYRHDNARSVVDQREVGKDVASFAAAVVGVLRCDPDVIVVGEMRDASTISATLLAAETGHLVFATMHTADAAQTIDRITGAFDGAAQMQARVQLAQSLLGVICMRLIPRARAAGRRCAAEVLLANQAVRALIRDGRTHQLRNVMVTSGHSGMQTLESHLRDLVVRGEVAAQEAAAATEQLDDIGSPTP